MGDPCFKKTIQGFRTILKGIPIGPLLLCNAPVICNHCPPPPLWARDSRANVRGSDLTVPGLWYYINIHPWGAVVTNDWCLSLLRQSICRRIIKSLRAWLSNKIHVHIQVQPIYANLTGTFKTPTFLWKSKSYDGQRTIFYCLEVFLW